MVGSERDNTKDAFPHDWRVFVVWTRLHLAVGQLGSLRRYGTDLVASAILLTTRGAEMSSVSPTALAPCGPPFRPTFHTQNDLVAVRP
jgi:hypothetical protein